jgi:hypothetical protein
MLSKVPYLFSKEPTKYFPSAQETTDLVTQKYSSRDTVLLHSNCQKIFMHLSFIKEDRGFISSVSETLG